MKVIQRIIYAGFAAVAIASASMPVLPAHSNFARLPSGVAGLERQAQADRAARPQAEAPPARAADPERR